MSAKRHAKALFDLAKEAGDVKIVAEDLARLADLVSNKEIKRILEHPRTTKAQCEAVFQEVLGKKASDVVKKYIPVLIKSKRIDQLVATKEAFDANVAQEEDIVKAVVYAAGSVSEKQKKAFVKTLENRFKKKIAIAIERDDTLLGGVVVKVGSQMLDLSVRGKLEQLRHLSKNALTES